jgi:transcriptional regulator with XRE-family HTH domain
MSLDAELQELGPRLKALRERAGLTQAELAERCGLSLGTLGGLERRWRDGPRITTLVSLARGLGLSMHALMVELFPPPAA